MLSITAEPTPALVRLFEAYERTGEAHTPSLLAGLMTVTIDGDPEQLDALWELLPAEWDVPPLPAATFELSAGRVGKLLALAKELEPDGYERRPESEGG